MVINYLQIELLHVLSEVSQRLVYALLLSLQRVDPSIDLSHVKVGLESFHCCLLCDIHTHT